MREGRKNAQVEARGAQKKFITRPQLEILGSNFYIKFKHSSFSLFKSFTGRPPPCAFNISIRPEVCQHKFTRLNELLS